MHNPILSTDETRMRTIEQLAQLAQAEDPTEAELEELRAAVEERVCANKTYAGPHGPVKVITVGRNIFFDGPGCVYVAFEPLDDGDDDGVHSLPFLIFFETYTPVCYE